jgi:hypothetical protein
MSGADTGGDGALRGDKTCGCAGACSARGADGVSDCRGGSSSNSMAGWQGVDGNGDGDGGGEGGGEGGGGEQHPSICGICLFLAKTAARLLARVAALYVLALFPGRGAGCGDTISGGDSGWNGSTCGDGEVASGVTEMPALAGLGVLSSSVEWV